MILWFWMFPLLELQLRSCLFSRFMEAPWLSSLVWSWDIVWHSVLHDSIGSQQNHGRMKMCLCQPSFRVATSAKQRLKSASFLKKQWQVERGNAHVLIASLEATHDAFRGWGVLMSMMLYSCFMSGDSETPEAAKIWKVWISNAIFSWVGQW